jgi:hypothetical protein
MKKNKNVIGWRGDLFISALFLFFIIYLRSNYNMDVFTNGTVNPTKDGGVIIALIDQLFGKEIVFAFLISMLILFMCMAYKDYLRDCKEEIYYQKWQRFYIKVVRYISIICTILVFVGLPVYAITNRIYYNNKIEKNGEKTIIYISEDVKQHRGHYVIAYFYVGNEKYMRKIRSLSSKKVNTFMKIKYLRTNPDRFIIDKESNIPIDSVCKYFPQGKNPFEEEIKRIKHKNKDSNGVVWYK